MRILSRLSLILGTVLLMSCGNSEEEAVPVQPAPPGDSEALSILDVSTRDYENRLALSILASKPLDGLQDFDAVIQVNGTQGDPTDGGWVLDEAGTGLYYTSVEPQSEYEITIKAGLTAADGDQLSLTQTASVKTRNLIAAAMFDFRGSVMPRSGPVGLPVVSTNVDSVNVNFHRVRPARVPEFMRVVKQNRYYRYQLELLAGMSELVYSGRFELEAEKNTRTQRLIPLDQIEPLNEPGLYIAIMEQPGTYDYERAVTYFAVSDLAMHVRMYGGNATASSGSSRTDAWVLGLKDGQPQSNVTIQALYQDGQIAAESITGSDGSATFASLNNAVVLLAQRDDSYCLVELRNPAMDLSSFDLGSRPQQDLELFFYGPRDLYRPGETVEVAALLRDGDGMPAPGATTLRARLIRPDGVVLRSFNWSAGDLGFYSRKLPIPSSAPTGRWKLRVDAPFEKPVDYAFLVEDFLPERMRLDLEPDQLSFKPDQPVGISMLGEYLFGAPAAGNRTSAIVEVERLLEPLADLPGFRFGNLTDQSLEQQFELTDIPLDAQGAGKLQIPSQWPNTSSPLAVTASVTLYESGGRPVTRAVTTEVWPEGPQLAVRPSFPVEGPPQNSVTEFEIIKVTRDNKRSALDAEAVLIREDRQYYWEYTDSEGWHYEYTQAEYPVGRQAIAAGADAVGRAGFPVEWGFYRLEVTDEGGQKASVRFHAGRNWYANWRRAQDPNQPSRPDEIKIAFDQEAYAPGSVARVHIKPPAPGPSIVLVESDQPLWQKQLNIPAGGATVDVPISEDWHGHNLYVSAITVAEKPGDAVPHRAFGLAHLVLDRETRRLPIVMSVAEEVRPETQLTVTLKLDQPQSGARVMATIAAVDAGVLSLTDFSTPDPHAAFFGQRRYQTEIRDMFGELIDTTGRDAATLRFGGDSAGRKGGQKPPTDSRIIALFSGPVTFDDSGEATTTLEIPEFSGELRVMSVAFSESQFGSAQASVKVAAPLIAELAGPRFLANGDESQLIIDLTNLTDDAQTLSTRLSASGAISGESLSRSLTLAPGQREKLAYTVGADLPMGMGEVHLEITSPSLESISRKWQIGTRPAYPAIRSVNRSVLEPGDSLTLPSGWGADLVPATADARFSVASSPDLNVSQFAKDLAQYPYGCLEQTTSKGFAVAWATPNRQAQLGLALSGTDKRQKLVQMTLDRLVELQRHDGSFSMWDRTGSESPWLTTYAAGLLVELRDQGFSLPPDMLEKVLARLGDYMNGRGAMQERYSNTPTHYMLAVQAQAGLLLAQLRRVRLDQLRNIYDTQHTNARSRLPLIQLGLALLLQGDAKRGEAALDAGLTMVTKPQYLGDYGSEIRDLATTIDLLLRLKQRESAALELSYQLVDALKRRNWLSTQENTALLSAGLQLGARQHQNWTGTLSLEGVNSSLRSAGVWNRQFAGAEVGRSIQLTSQHDQPLFVTYDVGGYPEDPPEPVSSGLSLERTYYDLQGSVIDPETIRSGQVLVVHITVAADQRTPDALVVDLLPAGLELEIQSLAHTLQLDQFTLAGRKASELIQQTELKHQEYRDDRYVAAVSLRRGQPAHLVYLARAVTPGRYRHPPAFAEDMYAPDLRAISDSGAWLTVQP